MGGSCPRSEDEVGKRAQKGVKGAAKEQSDDGAGEDDVGIDEREVGGWQVEEAWGGVDSGKRLGGDDGDRRRWRWG